LHIFLRLALNKKHVSKTNVSTWLRKPDFDISFQEGFLKEKPIRAIVVARPLKNATLLDCACFCSKARFNNRLAASLSTGEIMQEFAGSL
jgi:hypothetical protein